MHEIVRFSVDTLWKALGVPWKVLGTPWVDVWGGLGDALGGLRDTLEDLLGGPWKNLGRTSLEDFLGGRKSQGIPSTPGVNLTPTFF